MEPAFEEFAKKPPNDGGGRKRYPYLNVFLRAYPDALGGSLRLGRVGVVVGHGVIVRRGERRSKSVDLWQGRIEFKKQKQEDDALLAVRHAVPE